MGPYMSLCVLMGLCVLIGLYASLCVHMGFLCIHMRPYASYWSICILIVPYGFLHVVMGPNGS